MELSEIVKGCVKRDRRCQRLLYELYYSRMMVVCRRYVSNRDDAAAILNEGFLKIYLNIEKYAGDNRNLDGWMYRIIVNTAIDHCRKEMANRHFTEISEETMELGQFESVTDSINAKALLEMVQQLTPAYRLAFNLYEIEGYKHEEIAAMLGISTGASKSNLARAKGKLQQMILAENTKGNQSPGNKENP